MSQVISATTKFRPGGSKKDEFLSKAHVLMGQARSEFDVGKFEVALESAYRAALRTAGARIADSKVAARKRKPQGAWEQLKLVGEDGKQWAEVFSRYSRTRSRVVSGLDATVPSAVVEDLMKDVAAFLMEVEGGDGWLPAAA